MNWSNPDKVKIILKWWVALLAGLLVLEGVLSSFGLYHHHSHFDHHELAPDSLPTFFSVYGFLSCTLMVVVAKKIIGTVLKRKDSFYDED